MSTIKDRLFFNNGLKTKIDDATNVDDLLSLMRSIPMHKIKTFVKENVNEFDDSLCKSSWYNSSPISEILSSDVNQRILSFLTFDSTKVKSVSKKWNELSNQNEFNYYRNLKNSLNENEYVQYNPKKNKIWIVDAKRTDLTQIEKNLNFHGPISEIDGEKQAVNSGDVCLIHGAIEILDFPTSITMIGIGDNAKMTDTLISGLVIVENSNVHFENLTFELSPKIATSSEGAINIEDSAKVSLKNCNLNLGKAFCGIACRRESCLAVDDCVFDGASTAISISPASNNVIVKNSIFKHCGEETECKSSSENACIQIDDNGWGDARSGGHAYSVKLTCIGNVFENNLCFPIAERAAPVDRDDPDGEMEAAKYVPTNLYTLKGNELKGSNETSGPLHITMDANKMYFNTSKFKLY